MSEQTGPPDPATYPRTVLLVAGAGRSGTSTLAVLLQILGMHVPQPEVAADASNPKGFGEPRWAVDHHDRLLARAGVAVGDARPQAWFDTGQLAASDEERATVASWLEGHLADHPELVVKDPRLSWFLGLWRVAAERAQARPVVATMLRPPAEVAGSRAKYYNNKLGAAHLVASWVNMLLHTELATRDTDRAFVRYADLLDDWVRTTQHVGRTLDLRHVLDARSEQVRDGHRFIDPSLRRITVTLDELDLPARLREITEESWRELDALVEPAGDNAERRATLDQLLAAYVDLYAESEAISRSTVVAATARAGGGVPGGTVDRGGSPSLGETSLVDRVPHGLRAAIPPALRRGLRKALGKQR
ncbi:sulfotransferase family protein [Nocardioides bigeumensis]|uniref:Sulfotransferase family protein n=1 Tax=Nocardioides bigeumensis TaxID=433657 RepID=A0ABP5KJ02_9ACTN